MLTYMALGLELLRALLLVVGLADGCSLDPLELLDLDIVAFELVLGLADVVGDGLAETLLLALLNGVGHLGGHGLAPGGTKCTL